MPKVLFIEQYYYPEGWGGAEIPRDITVALRRAGFEVDVLCSSDQYAPVAPEHAAEDPTRHGIRIFRIPRILPGPIHRFKLLRILWFCAYALPWLLWHRDADLLVTQTNPLLVVPTVAFAALVRRKPFIIIAQDLYPEALFASGVTSPDSLAGRALQRLFTWSYRRAAQVVVLGAFMRQRILAKGVDPRHIATISNWATGDTRTVAEDNPLRTEWGLLGRFVVLYSGNIGEGHEFETLLRGVQRAVTLGADNLTLVFVGAGVRLGELRSQVTTLGLEDRVVFKSFVPASMLPYSLGLGNLALVTLRAGFEGIIVPSKLLGYMARGIPVLYIGPDSDIAEMIRAANCGACCNTGDVEAVAAVLSAAAAGTASLRQWSRSGQNYYSGHLARERGVQQYVALIRATVCA